VDYYHVLIYPRFTDTEHHGASHQGQCFEYFYVTQVMLSSCILNFLLFSSII